MGGFTEIPSRPENFTKNAAHIPGNGEPDPCTRPEGHCGERFLRRSRHSRFQAKMSLRHERAVQAFRISRGVSK